MESASTIFRQKKMWKIVLFFRHRNTTAKHYCNILNINTLQKHRYWEVKA